MKSIFYKYPALYDFGIRFLYFDGLKIVKDIIGKKKTVFEPACGFGRMEKYLYPDCSYSGIDLNEKFVEYGRKRNIDIKLGNALDKKNYQRSDAILLCDILHHLKIKDIRKLVSIAVHHAVEKIVIIEPLFVSIASKNNMLSRAIGKLMACIDDDGYNRIERWMSKSEYKDLFHSLKESNGIKEMNVKEYRNHGFVEMRK